MMRSQLNRITQLARAGALAQAWALFEAGGPHTPGSADDPETLSVYGRLLKDRAAREEGALRDELLNSAIAAYRRASDLSHASYPLINAATLAFLAGRAEQSRSLATQTIALLDSLTYAPETPYWLTATRAEAMLLLGRREEAEILLGRAVRHQPDAWEDHASTLRQFALILNAGGNSDTWLDRFRPPPCLHFDGILGIAADDTACRDRIGERIAALAPGSAFGALAAGADILAAEAVVQAGGHLHAVLPCPPDIFRETSVRPSGGDWESRYDRLLEAAASLLILDDIEAPSDASIAIAREAAMGLTLRESRRLQTTAGALRMRVADERGAPASDIYWDRLELPLHTLWIERSDPRGLALPSHAEAQALLALPAALETEMPPDGAPIRAARQQGRSILAYATLAGAAEAAAALADRHPEARIGLDYRAGAPGTDDPSDQPPYWGRARDLSTSRLTGAVALSETAALALALQNPEANVQPMGDIRLPTGDLPLYALFPEG